MAKYVVNATKIKLDATEHVGGGFFGFGGHVLVNYPDCLKQLALRLYQFRSGVLLGSVVGHTDERILHAVTFQHAAFRNSVLMSCPQMYLYDPATQVMLEKVATVDLALQSHLALMLDCGSEIFIWVGYQLSEQPELEQAACQVLSDKAIRLSHHRCPVPRVRMFREGMLSDPARYLYG